MVQQGYRRARTPGIHLGIIIIVLVAVLAVGSPAKTLALSGYRSGSNGSDYAITDYNNTHSPITISGAPAGAQIDYIEISYNIDHDYVWDLKVWFGTESWSNESNPLDYHASTTIDDWCCGESYDETLNRENVHFSSTETQFLNQAINQTWYLVVNDGYGGDQGRIDSWSIRIYYKLRESLTVRMNNATVNSGSSTTIVGELDGVNSDPDNRYVYGYLETGSTNYYLGYDVTGWGITYLSGQFDLPVSSSVTRNLCNGNYTVRAEFHGDDDWYPATGTSTLTVNDRTPPDYAPGNLTDNVTGWSSDNTPTFSWTAPTDPCGIKGYYWSTSDSTPDSSDSYTTSRSVTLPAQPDGTRTFYVAAVDWYDNVGPAVSHSFSIDTSPPSAPGGLTDDVSSWSSDATPTFRWSAPSDVSGITRYYYSTTDSTPDADDSWTTSTSVTLPAQPSGTYTFYVAAMNGGGLIGPPASHTFQIDVTGPTTPGTPDLLASDDTGSSSTDNITRDSSIRFDWTAASDSHSGVAGYYWALDDTTPSSGGNWTTNLYASGINAPEGARRIYVQARDNAGNVGGVSQLLFTIDRAAPTPPTFSSPDEWGMIDDPSPTLSWQPVTDGWKYQVFVRDHVLGILDPGRTSPELTSTQWTVSPDLAYKDWGWQVKAWDTAGNEGSYGRNGDSGGWGHFSIRHKRTAWVYIRDANGDYATGAQLKLYSADWSTLVFEGTTDGPWQVDPEPYLFEGTYPYEIFGPVLADGSRAYWGTGEITIGSSGNTFYLDRTAPYVSDLRVLDANEQYLDYRPACANELLTLRAFVTNADPTTPRLTRVTPYVNASQTYSNPMSSQAVNIDPDHTSEVVFSYRVPSSVVEGQTYYIDPVIEGWYNNHYVYTDRVNWNSAWAFTVSNCPPPQVTDHSPDGDGLPVNLPDYIIMAEFNQDLEGDSVNSSTMFVQTLSGQTVPGTTIYDGAVRTAYFNLDGPLSYNTTYRVTIKGGPNGVRSVNTSAMASDYTWEFTTVVYRGTILSHSSSTFVSDVESPLTLVVKNTGTGTTSYRIEPKNVPSGWSLDEKDGDWNEYVELTNMQPGATAHATFYVTPPDRTESATLEFELKLDHPAYGWQVFENTNVPSNAIQDTTPPQITGVNVQQDNLGHLTVYATVVDPATGSGVDTNTIEVFYDDIDDIWPGHAHSRLNNTSGDQYQRTIPEGGLFAADDFTDRHRLSLYIKARDRAGNETRIDISPMMGVYVEVINGQGMDTGLAVVYRGDDVVDVRIKSDEDLGNGEIRTRVGLYNRRFLWLELLPTLVHNAERTPVPTPPADNFSSGSAYLFSLFSHNIVGAFVPNQGDVLSPLAIEVIKWPPIWPDEQHIDYDVQTVMGDQLEVLIKSRGITIGVLNVIEPFLTALQIPIMSQLNAVDKEKVEAALVYVAVFNEVLDDYPRIWGHIEEGRYDEALRDLAQTVTLSLKDEMPDHFAALYQNQITDLVSQGLISPDWGSSVAAKAQDMAIQTTKALRALAILEAIVNESIRLYHILITPDQDMVRLEHTTNYDVDFFMLHTISQDSGLPGADGSAPHVLRWQLGQDAVLEANVLNIGSQFLFDVWLVIDLYEPPHVQPRYDSSGTFIGVDVSPGRKIETIRTPLVDPALQDTGDLILNARDVNNTPLTLGAVSIGPDEDVNYRVLNYALTQTNHPAVPHTFYPGTYRLVYKVYVDGPPGDQQGVSSRQLGPTREIEVQVVDNGTPDAPQDLVIAENEGWVALNWAAPPLWTDASLQTPDNRDIAGYLVYRATTAGAVTSGEPHAFLRGDEFIFLDNDETFIEGQTYYYAVRAVDLKGTYSPFTETVSIVPKPRSPVIEGTIRDTEGQPVPNVVLGGLPEQVQTNENGHYSARVPAGWSGTVTPELAGYSFLYLDSDQSYQHYSNLTGDMVGQDYTAIPRSLSISGTITAASDGAPLGHVLVTASAGGGSDTTDGSDGHYELYVPHGWSGTLSVAKTGYTFLPESQTSFQNVTQDQSQDYQGQMQTFTISGYVRMAGSPDTGVGGVALQGLPNTVTSGGNGYYVVTVPYGWSGVVTPLKTDTTFEPEITLYSAVTEHKTQDYTATTCAPLGTISYAFPSNQAPNVPVTVSLDWHDVSGAATYDVFFGATYPPALHSSTTASHVSLPPLLPGVQYHWMIRAYNACQQMIEGPKWSFTTDMSNTAPVLTWTGEANYESDGLHPESGGESTSFEYRVTYMDDDGDSPAFVRLHVFKGSTEIAGSPFAMAQVSGTPETGAVYAYAMSGLLAGNDYSYTVAAQDQHGANAAPLPAASAPVVSNAINIVHSPLSVAQEDAAILVSADVTSTAAPLAVALYYRGPDMSSYASVDMLSVGSSTYEGTIPAGAVVPDRLQYFISAEAGSESTSTSTYAVTVVPIPDPPMLTSPDNGAIISDSTPMLSWNGVAGGATYRVQISSGGSFGTVIQNVVTAPGNVSYTATPLNDGQYFWRVKSINILGTSSTSWSPARSFTIDTVPPAAPALRTPPDNAVEHGVPTYMWLAVSGAATYQWQVDDAPDFVTPMLTSPEQASTSYVPGSQPVGTFYWRARARDAAGNWGPWSAHWTVTITAPVPSTVALTSPPSGSITRNNRPSFAWTNVLWGDRYEIQVDNDQNFSSPEQTSVVDGLSYTSGLLADAATYFWRVRAINENGVPGPWSDVWRLTVDTAPPPAPRLNAPRDRTNTPDNTPRFTWARVGGADRYHLQVSDQPNFSTLLVDDDALTRPNYTVPDTDTLAYTTYFWRVRAHDTAGNWSNWGTENTFTITLLKTLRNGDHTRDTTPTLRWARALGATRYWLQISTDASFTSPLVNEDSLSQLTYTPANPLPFGPLYWRVQVDLGGGYTANWTPGWIFTITPSVPSRPILQFPTRGTLTSATPDVLTWQPLGDGATYRYQVQLDDQNNFRSPLQDATLDPGETSYTPTPLTENGRAFWRVRAINEHGVAGQWSATWWFRLDALGRPTLIAPANRSTTASSSPTIEWGIVPDAAEYQLQISTDRRFGTVEQAATVAGTTYPADALPDGAYYWRTRALNNHGIAGTWSAIWQLTIDSDGPVAPVLSVPRQGGATPDMTPRLAWKASWGAVEYRVQVDDDPAFGSPLEWAELTRPAFVVPDADALPYGVYHWRVQGRDARDVWGAWSDAGTFTVTVLKSPADGAAMTNARPTFRWAGVAGAQYRLQISTIPGIDADPDPLVDEPRATTSYRPPAALPYGTLYWRVSLDDGTTWMPAWSVTITPTPPVRVALSAPKNRTLTTDSTPTLLWKAALRGETYQLQIDDDRRFGSPAQDVMLGAGVLSYTAGALPDGIYYWRARALNAFDAPGPWSAVWRLEVDTVAPVAPALIAPEDGARVTNAKLILQWARVSDAVSYEFQLDPDPAFPLPPSVAGRRTSYRLPTTIAQSIYFWRVRVMDKAGNVSAWSETRTFSLVAGNTALNAEPTAIPGGSEPNAVEIVLQVVEAEDPVVMRTGTWTAHDTPDASGGAYVYSSGSPDDAVSLRFSGTRLEVAYVRHPALGTFVVEVDGTLLQVVDSVSLDSEFGARAVIEVAEGEHTVRIYPQAGTIAIDAFGVEKLVVPESPIDLTATPNIETPAETPQPSPDPTIIPTVDLLPTLAPTPLPLMLPVILACDSDLGWTATGTWRVDATTAHNGSAWLVDDTPTEIRSVLTYNAQVDLRTATAPQLAFWQKGALAQADAVVIDLSLDGGVTWGVVDQQVGLVTDWVLHTVDLTPYRGGIVMLRFTATFAQERTDPAVAVSYWLDEISIQDVPVQPTVVPLPTDIPTTTPIPTEPPTPTLMPTEPPTATLMPTETPTDTPMASATPEPTLEPTVGVRPTEEVSQEVMPQDMAE